MLFDASPREEARTVFWWKRGTLIDRIGWLFPSLPLSSCDIVSDDLSSNAAFVNFVRRHKITNSVTGQSFDIVEKSVRKLAFVTSLEARFYREHDVLKASVQFHHPEFFGTIETPNESFIFTRHISGKSPRMRIAAPQIARGIAELEFTSHQHIQAQSSSCSLRYWTMDFYRPWYMLRGRFSFHRFFGSIENLAEHDRRFKGISPSLRTLGKKVDALALSALRSPKCFCHLDYLRKNLFVNPDGLHIIDWSEFKVGRVGFDAGSYLAALFRRSEMGRYESVRDNFIANYESELAQRFDVEQTLNNMRYYFLQNSLWQCMRPKSIKEFQDSNRLDLLREKLDYLISTESY